MCAINLFLVKKGNGSSLALSALCGVTALLTSIYYERMNEKKRQNQFTEEANILRQKNIHTVGHTHPGTYHYDVFTK